MVIGSTAERIVQHAPCPVLTVKKLGPGGWGATAPAAPVKT